MPIGQETKTILRHISPQNLSITNEHKIIFYLETGGLGTDTDITQISAVSFENEDSFDQYITPTKPISAGASAATGLQNHGGVLMKEGQPVPTLLIKQALLLFIDWLSDRGPCILIAHNSKFDSKHLIHHIINSKLVSSFQNCVHGFVDSLPYFKKKNIESYKTINRKLLFLSCWRKHMRHIMPLQM